MKLAIIGATGMLGHHTARAAVKAGHELVVVHRAGSKLDRIDELEFEARVGDLGDADALAAALKDVDVALNCAGYYPTVPKPWREEVDKATAEMGNFLRACEASDKLSRAVYLGGSIALQRRDDGRPGDETCDYDRPPRTTNAYVRMKWEMDRMAREAADKGLPVTIGIPTMTFGEYDYGPTTGRLLVEVANRTLPAYIRGNRNVVYAGDAGRGLLAVAERGEPGERYLIGGRNTTMDALIGMMAELAGVPTPRAAPLVAAKVLARVQSVRFRFGGPEPKLGPAAIAVMAGGQFLDCSKAERELGYRPEVSIESALERALGWFREVGYIRLRSAV